MGANITLHPQEHFLSAQHLNVDTAIANAILQKGTRFRQWDKNDYDLAVRRLQMPHADGGFGLTPNTIAQTSAKVAMASRFLGLVGSLSPDGQNLWLPNQVIHDPDTWTAPHLLRLKREYEILVDKYDTDVSCRKLSRCKTLLLPPQIHSYCRLSNAFIRPMYAFRSDLDRGILVRSCHRRSARCPDRS